MPLVEQEQLTLPEHLSLPPVFNGVRVTRSLVSCVCFVYRCLSCCSFSFGHCVVCAFSIYGFRLTFLVSSSSSCSQWPLNYLSCNCSDLAVFLVFHLTSLSDSKNIYYNNKYGMYRLNLSLLMIDILKVFMEIDLRIIIMIHLSSINRLVLYYNQN